MKRWTCSIWATACEPSTWTPPWPRSRRSAALRRRVHTSFTRQLYCTRWVIIVFWFNATGEKKIKADEFLPIYSQIKKEKDVGTIEDFLECMKLYDKSDNGLMIYAELTHILLSLGILFLMQMFTIMQSNWTNQFLFCEKVSVWKTRKSMISWLPAATPRTMTAWSLTNVRKHILTIVKQLS